MGRPRKYENCLSNDGANKIADQLREHWKQEGYNVKVWVEQTKADDGYFIVRSNLFRGLPIEVVIKKGF